MVFITGLAKEGWAAANYVYHEQSNRNAFEDASSTDCIEPQLYADIFPPSTGQLYGMTFRVEYHLSTDQARVYYTIDGSNPSGSLGNGSNSTLVITANYSCTATDAGNVTDLCRATIPAQRSGTTVKYIISAWSSADNLEIFANSGACNGCLGFTNSAQAAMFEYTVVGPPEITVHPQSRTNISGTEATFSVTAMGLAPLSYRWHFNGNALADATQASLAIPNVQSTNAGNYLVVVANSYGWATSTVAVLTVLTPPSITQQPVSLVVTQGTPATFNVVASGDVPLGYQWRLNAVNLSGATASSLSLTSAQTNNAGNYDVVVSNASGSLTSQVATLTVRLPPSIVQQPSSLTVTQGNSASFSVSARGDAPLSYQWRLNGANLSGATGSNYTIASAQGTNIGNYVVVVLNGSGSITSQVASLTVRLPPAITQQPASLTVTQGSSANFSVSASGDPPLNYQWRFKGTNLSGATASTLSIASAQTNHAGNYDVVVSNNFGSVTSLLATLVLRVPPSIVQQPISQTVTQGQATVFMVVASGDTPFVYRWRFNSATIPDATNATYVIGNAQPGLAGNYDVVVSNGSGSVTSMLASLTVLVPPTITAQPQSLVMTQGQTAFFSVTANGTAPLFYQWRFGKNDLPGETNRILMLTNVQSSQAGGYQVRVSNAAGLLLSDNALLTVLEPPAMTQQPVSRTNLLGSAVTFSVTATGTTPLTYQWYFNTNTPLSGATNSTLLLPQLQTAQAGTYHVVVTNQVGVATSQVATLAVVVPPLILQQPISLTLTQGQDAAFSVVAGGDIPLSYQWRLNGLDLSGATNATLTISNVQPSSAGTFRVVISNAVGSLTSLVATLTVHVFDFGDAPPGYPTLLADNGARHRLAPGIYLGTGVDFEQNGQPDATATGDNLTGLNDEDGVSFAAPLRAGQTATAIVIASTNGLLQGWIDFNINTNWGDVGEQIFTNRSLVPGTNQLSFQVPATATLGVTFARFRFSTASGLSWVGPASDGEVEDYSMAIQAAADLGLVMSDQPDPVLVGNNLTYSIAITNRGASAANNVMLTDALPGSVTYVSSASSQGTCTNSAGTIVCSLGSLSPGSNAFVTLVVRALAPGTITNTAAIAATEFDPNLADNTTVQITASLLPARSFSNTTPMVMEVILKGPATPYPSTIVVSGFTTAVYKVTATLSNVSHSYPDDMDILLVGPGGQNVMLMSDAGINFRISGVTLTFDDAAAAPAPNSEQLVTGSFRPANYEQLDAMVAPAPPSPYGTALSVFRGTNPNGTWSLYVVDDTSEDGGDIADGWSLNITTIDPISDLAVTQRDAPDPGAIGTNLTYTITVTNFGPAMATGVRLTDPLPGGLNFVSLTNTSGNCTNDNGLITCGWDNLVTGAGAVITVVVKPVFGGIFTNVVQVNGQQLDQNPSNNIAAAVTTVTAVTDLAIATVGSPATVLLGQPLTYTVLVTNLGPNLAGGVIVSDLLPAGVQFVSAVSSRGGCTNVAGTVTCALGSLANLATATITIISRPDVLGVVTNVVSVAGDQFDSVPVNSTASAVNTVDPAADTALSMTASPQPVGLGQTVTYSMVVSNQGPSAAANVSLRDVMPPNAAFAGVTSSQGACTNDGAGAVVCDLGGLAAGGSVAITLSVVPSALGNITNSATLLSSPADPNPTNNAAQNVSSVVTIADVAVSPSDFPDPVWRGDNLVYTVVITNKGPSQATGVVLQDTLPVSVNLISAVASQGSCGSQAGVVSCNLGALNSANQALVTITVRPLGLGNITNHTRVSATELDLDLTNNQVDQTTAIIAPAGLFAHNTRLVIPNLGTATPYPSTTLVSGLTAAVAQVRVTLTNLSHTYPDDLDILLVGPNGQTALLMSDAGGEANISNITLRFDDQALFALPDSGPITSGTYKPSDYEPGDPFPAPAPTGPYGTNLAVFNGIDPNGPWSLYIVDDSTKDNGTLDGWSLEIAVRDPLADLAISRVDLPEAVAMGSNISFAITVSNRGPALATQVRLTNQLPVELVLNAFNSTQGACTNDQGLLFCDLGNLPAGSNAVIQISVVPTNPVSVTNFASIGARELDLNLLNNALTSVTTIENSPVITLQPLSYHLTNGESVALMVMATGTEPLLYQWQRNGIDLFNATNSSLPFDNASPLNSGAYRARVSNRVGTVFSATATLLIVGPPTISDIAAQFTDEDTPSALIPFTIGDTESAPETLLVSGSSANPALISDANIIFAGSGSNWTVRLVPLPNQVGTAVISVRVTDPDGGVTTVSFLLTVRPVNDPPAISPVPDQATAEDTPAVISFLVDDLDSPPSSLTVTASSSNPALVPDANLVPSGSGNNRTVTATPLPDQSGTTIITLVAMDENGATATVHFLLTVTPVNDPPTLAPINNVVIDENAGVQTVSLTGIGSGAANETQRLRLTAFSSNLALITNPSVQYTSPNSTGTLTFVPLAHVDGTAIITVTVNDGQSQNSTFSRSFTVQVRPVNDPPSISHLTNQVTLEDTPVSLPIVVGDDNPPLDNLVLSATSSNLTLVPLVNVAFAGTGANRIATITPAANQFGTTDITIIVTDTNGATASDSFVLTVGPVNDPPSLDPISDRIVSEDAGQQTVNLTGLGSGATNETQTLTVTAASSNPVLIPTPTVAYTNSNSTGTLRFTPATNASGSAVITVTVSDGGASNAVTTRAFTVTVNPVNDPPVISTVANVNTPENVLVIIPFSIGDTETSPSLLVVTASSSNTNLAPNARLFIDGSSSNRTVAILPATNQSGTATISLSVSDGITNSTTTFVLTVAPVNIPPTLDVIPDQVVNEAVGFFNVGFTGVSSGATNEAQALTVTAVSSNSTLVSFQSVTYTSPGTTGSLRLRTTAGQGTAVMAVTVNDNGASNNVFTRTFTVFVKAATNASPTISALTTKTINEDTSTGPIAFTVNDVGTAPGSLTLTGRSSNPTMVPATNILFGGSGSSRTVNITPATNQNGATVITIWVQDAGFGIVSNSFLLTVNPSNDVPRISAILDQSMLEDAAPPIVLFTVDDIETPAANLLVSAHSSNASLVPDANLRLGGSGTNRALVIVPATNQNGTATITVTVSDGLTNSVRAFQLTVTATNDPPTLSNIGDQSTPEDTPTAPIAFTIDDPETSVASLTLSAAPSNPTLIPTANIVFEGTNNNRTVRITPATNRFGASTITLTVTDGNGATASGSFLLSVTPVNDTPTLAPISNRTLNQSAGPQTIALTGITSGATNESQTLVVSASSSDTMLMGNLSVTYTSPNTNGTLTFTPVPGAYGTATITVTVNDGQLVNNLFTRTFTVTITQPPTIPDVPDQTIDEDTAISVAFTVNDLETPAANLVVTGVSSNPALVPNTSLVFGGSGANRTLNLSALTNASGTAFITLTVTDAETNSAQTSFLLTVNPVADVPAILTAPQSQTVTNGAPVLLQVAAASGLGPLQYQWQRNDVDLPGQTTTSLVFPSAQPADSGAYKVRVSNADASVTTAPAQLRVLVPSGIAQLVRIGAATRISFASIVGPTYTIEYTAVLAPTQWTVLTSVPGSGEVITIEDAPPGAQTRFYRLRIE